MIRRAVSFISALAVLVFALALAGCSSYVSSYRATGFVHSNMPRSSFMAFSSFDGRMTFKMKTEGRLDYSLRLGSGSAAVFYDFGGTKTELCGVKSGEEISSSAALPGKGTVWVIVETDGECLNGDFSFRTE